MLQRTLFSTNPKGPTLPLSSSPSTGFIELNHIQGLDAQVQVFNSLSRTAPTSTFSKLPCFMFLPTTCDQQMTNACCAFSLRPEVPFKNRYTECLSVVEWSSNQSSKKVPTFHKHLTPQLSPFKRNSALTLAPVALHCALCPLLDISLCLYFLSCKSIRIKVSAKVNENVLEKR